jgi:hypothetical protein
MPDTNASGFAAGSAILAGILFTILPEWLTPSGHFTLQCRQEACERISAGDTAEQAAPHCRGPSRLPGSFYRTSLVLAAIAECVVLVQQRW